MGFSIGLGFSVGNKLTPLSGVSAGDGLSFSGFTPPTPAAPVNTTAPVISGTPASGQTLFSDTGSWSGYPSPTYGYQWKADGVDIGGATSSSFLLTNTQIGAVITCVVTATNSEGSASQSSNSLGPVTAALAAPANTVAPVASGTGTVGQTLSVTNGTWTGNPSPTYTYQWQRNGSNIGSATASTYLLVDADNGTSIRCVVTGTNSQGSASANSNAISVAAYTSPVNTVAPVASGTPTVGSTLSVTDGTWTGTPTPTFTYQWRRDGVNIGGATANTYLLVLADDGTNVDCVVTGTNYQGSSSADSNDIPIGGGGGGTDIEWGSLNSMEWGSGNSLTWGV